MFRFYASIRGQARTEATRRGSAGSGITGHIRGWESGVRVVARVGGDGSDTFDVYLTAGSKGKRKDIHLGTVRGSVPFVQWFPNPYAAPQGEAP